MVLVGENILLGFGEAGQETGVEGGPVLTGEATLARLSPKETVTGREGRVGVVWKKDRAFIWDPSVKARVEGLFPHTVVEGEGGDDAVDGAAGKARGS